MRVPSPHSNRQKSQPLADLLNKTAELERKLGDVRMSLESELAHPARGREAVPDQIQEICACGLDHIGHEYAADTVSFPCAVPGPAHGYRGAYFAGADVGGNGADFAGADAGGDGAGGDGAGGDGAGGDGAGGDGADFADADTYGAEVNGAVFRPVGRTTVLVNHGRHTAYRRGFSRGLKVAAGTAVVAALATIVVVMMPGAEASWPPSVARVQSEIAIACQNPDVKSEPGQVNFACAKATRQILWVFSLMTSDNKPNFADIRTGRVGLEPIAPAQGGEVASSLNLHHPYSPSNPVDSLEVAARAINDIVGGATLTGSNGYPVVQSGLEGNPANCVRYTGSAAVSSHQGFPGLCARPVTSPAGQAALVADVFQKWVIGAPPQAAQDAAVLFENANNPGDPQVRAILMRLPTPALSP